MTAAQLGARSLSGGLIADFASFGSALRSKKTKETSKANASREAAHSLELDEFEERFKAALKKVAAHKPPSNNMRGRKPGQREG